MAALDEVRKDIWHDAYSEYKQVKKDNPRGKGRPKKNDPEFAIVKAAKVHVSPQSPAYVPYVVAEI
mgnify:FL=1